MKKRPAPPRASKARRSRPAAKARPRGTARRGGVLKLPAQCTLADAQGLKLRLAKLLKNVKPVTVDAHGVQRIDTASLQLLAAFALERGASSLTVSFASASDEFADATRLLGFGHLLDAGAAASPEIAR
jgi:anti-anti-sigma regulatory factor